MNEKQKRRTNTEKNVEKKQRETMNEKQKRRTMLEKIGETLNELL